MPLGGVMYTVLVTGLILALTLCLLYPRSIVTCRAIRRLYG